MNTKGKTSTITDQVNNELEHETKLIDKKHEENKTKTK